MIAYKSGSTWRKNAGKLQIFLATALNFDPANRAAYDKRRIM